MKKYLQSFHLFDAEEIDQIMDSATTRSIGKEDFFIQHGSTCNEISFIQSGIFRTFYYSEEGEELTYCINFPGNFMTAYSSYITGAPTVENIQALTDAVVYVLQKKDIEQQAEKNLHMAQFLRTMAEQQYLVLENRIFQLQKETSKQRYLNLVQDHPDYIRHIPLQYLASYLGITQRHLSRLRKEISF